MKKIFLISSHASSKQHTDSGTESSSFTSNIIRWFHAVMFRSLYSIYLLYDVLWGWHNIFFFNKYSINSTTVFTKYYTQYAQIYTPKLHGTVLHHTKRTHPRCKDFCVEVAVCVCVCGLGLKSRPVIPQPEATFPRGSHTWLDKSTLWPTVFFTT